jgi:hypothetical protein
VTCLLGGCAGARALLLRGGSRAAGPHSSAACYTCWAAGPHSSAACYTGWAAGPHSSAACCTWAAGPHISAACCTCWAGAGGAALFDTRGCPSQIQLPCLHCDNPRHRAEASQCGTSCLVCCHEIIVVREWHNSSSRLRISASSSRTCVCGCAPPFD